MISGPVDVVKIDVEGAEPEVLQGMTRILDESKSLSLFVEWNPACLRHGGYDPLDLPAHLQKLGFEVRVIDDRQEKILDLHQVLPSVKAGNLPDSWYVNLWCKRK